MPVDRQSPLTKPAQLQPGDRIAAVSLSWGGPGTFPWRYQAGKRQLEAAFGVQVVEMPHTLADAAWLARNPQARADDLMTAFSDPGIRGIISTIGGDDSIRLLPHVDLTVLRENPKVFMGYSDTTVSHFLCRAAGLVSFYGPSFMAGFGENGGLLPYMTAAVRRILFSAEAPGLVEPNRDGWTVEHLDWADPTLQERKRVLQPCTGWRFLQGEGTVRGRLIGGCLEVLDWLRGSPLWPAPHEWSGSILFIETSEEAPSPESVVRMLRALRAAGALEHLSGLLVGRPGGQVDPAQFPVYDRAVLQVICDELGNTKLPIVAGMDFGHTDPMMVLPMGVEAEINCEMQTFAILEAGVIAR